MFAKVPQAIHPWHHELNNWVEDLQQQPEDLLANSWRSVSGRAAVDEPPLSATKKLEVESVENRSVLSSLAKLTSSILQPHHQVDQGAGCTETTEKESSEFAVSCSSGC